MDASRASQQGRRRPGSTGQHRWRKGHDFKLQRRTECASRVFCASGLAFVSLTGLHGPACMVSEVPETGAHPGTADSAAYICVCACVCACAVRGTYRTHCCTLHFRIVLNTTICISVHTGYPLHCSPCTTPCGSLSLARSKFPPPLLSAAARFPRCCAHSRFQFPHRRSPAQ